MNDCVDSVVRREAADAARVGPRPPTSRRWARAGLPIPDGFCLDGGRLPRARSPRLGLEATARDVFATDDGPRRAGMRST